MLDGEAESIVRKVITLAKRGNAFALRLCFERIFPARRGRPVAITLPEVKTSADVVAALSAVVAATALGELTPDEAAQLSAVVELQRKALEMVELEARLARLEQKVAST
jgi:hypothetical protein